MESVVDFAAIPRWRGQRYEYLLLKVETNGQDDLKDKVKYDVDTTARCTECGEDINVGTAGPAGLSQHTGKSRCRKNIENKKKQEKQSKIRTLFDVGVKKGKDIPQGPVMPEVSSSTRKALVSPLPIIVYPSKAPTSSNASEPESLGTKERQGCLLGWEIVDRLRQASKRINLNIPIAEEGDEISTYAGRGNAEAHCAGVSNDEVWEVINPGLDRLLGFGRPRNEIQSIIRRGPNGIDGFCNYLEYLIAEKGLKGGLIEGKVSALIDAIGTE